MIQIKDLNIDLPGFSLQDIDLHIQEKDFFALIGPTGSGKSLLMEAIMGLVPVKSGQITLQNRDIGSLPVEKRKIAMVYQDFALFPHLSVRDNILYGIRYRKIPEKEINARFKKLVDTLGLEHRLTRYPGTLSGGEKQRVALARALILNPPALLLDEPLSALDPMFHGEIRELLKSIHRDLGITIVLITHNFSEVMYLANRGAIIKDGKIVQTGEVRNLFEKPDSLFAARFVGMKNIFEVSPEQGHIMLGDERIETSENRSDLHNRLAIRPEEISLVIDEGKEIDHMFNGTVKRISCEGIGFDVLLESGGLEFTASWSVSQIKAHKIDMGSNVNFGFQNDAVHTIMAY